MRPSFLSVLLRPSVFSSIVNVLLALAVLAAANWSYVLERLLFYSYFFGPDGLITTTRGDASGLFGGAIGNNLTVIAAAVIIGLLVYGGLQLWGRAKLGAAASMEVARAQSRRRTIREVSKGVLLRLVLTAGWLVYAIFFFKTILPSSVLASEVGIRALWAPRGALFILFGVALLWLALHGHVIWMRLFVLRPRVFGGADVLLR